MRGTTIIAVDIGEVTTAACKVCPEQSRAVVPLEINGKVHQPTALASHPMRGNLLGTNAIRTPDATNLHTRFKASRGLDDRFKPEHHHYLDALTKHWIDSKQIPAEANLTI